MWRTVGLVYLIVGVIFLSVCASIYIYERLNIAFSPELRKVLLPLAPSGRPVDGYAFFDPADKALCVFYRGKHWCTQTKVIWKER